MSRYPQAKFVQSANKAAQFVADDGREVAFAGRSNAGKSSAINAIVGRRQFAKTSKTPGRTQLVNFFELASGKRLVDLPGYGFAKVSAAVQEHWGRLLTRYFRERESLAGLIVVVDARRGLKPGDHQLLAFAEDAGIPIGVLLSKADKLKRGQAAAVRLAVARELEGRAEVALFSAVKKTGVEEARGMLSAFLDGAKTSPGRSP